MGQGVGADLRPAVFHGEGGAAVQPAAPHAHLRPFRGVEGGVGQEIAHNLFQHGLIPGDRHARRQIGDQPLPPQAEHLIVLREPPPEKGGQVHALPTHLRGACLHAGDGEHLADEALHAPGDLQGTEQILVPVPISAHAVQHPGELALEDGDRRLEFMGGGGEKGRPLPVQFPLPFHLPLQCQVGLFQLFKGGGKALCHRVQAAPQRADLVPPPLFARPAEIQPGHLLRDAAQPHDGPGDGPGIDQRAYQRKRQQRKQQPGRHLRKRPHRQIFRLHPGRDIEGIGPGLVGKAHLGGERGLLGGGDAHRVLRRAPGIVGDRAFARGCAGDRVLARRRRFHGEPLPRARDLPVRPHQHGLRAGGVEESFQHGPAFLQGGIRQLVHQFVHLPGKVVADHGGVGAGRGPGDEAKGHGPGQQQNQRGHPKDARREAFSDLPSQHDSPPP